MNEALEYDIIDFDSVQQKIYAMKKEKILSLHPSGIYMTTVKSNGKAYERWITYVYKDGKRHQIKRKTKEEIEDYLVKYYTEEGAGKSEVVTPFKTMFEQLVKFKSLFVSDNTIYKHNTDYIRFFKDTDFENYAVEDINETTIMTFLAQRVKDLKLRKRALKDLCGYINECLEHARINRYIEYNPYSYIKPKLKLIYKLCKEDVYKSAEDRTLSVEEIHILLKKFQEDYKNKPEYITPYAVEFAMLTGCRVGEIAALRWSDIDGDIITIRSSEKAHRVVGQSTTYTIEGTKTGKERKIPLTTAMRDLLERVLTAENNISCAGEFVFSDKNGRIKSERISDCIRKKCKQTGISQKSIHACRRTVNSTLKSFGANTMMASSLLGHTCEVNDKCYTYDVSALDVKRQLLEQANKYLTEL